MQSIPQQMQSTPPQAFTPAQLPAQSYNTNTLQNFLKSAGETMNNFGNAISAPFRLGGAAAGYAAMKMGGDIGNYFGGNVVKPMQAGVQQMQQPGILNKGLGALQTAGAAFNATPGGVGFNAAFSGLTGLTAAIRTKNPIQGVNVAQSAFNQPTSFAQAGLGMKPGLAATAIDLATPFAMGHGLNVAGQALGFGNTIKIPEADKQEVDALVDAFRNSKGADKQTAEAGILTYVDRYLGKGWVDQNGPDAKKAIPALQQIMNKTYVPANKTVWGFAGNNPKEELPAPAAAGETQPSEFVKEMDALKAQREVNIPPTKPLTPEDLTNASKPIPLVKGNPLVTTANIPLKQAAQNALTEMTGTEQTIKQIAKDTADTVQAGIHGAQETRLFRDAVEHPENLSENLKQVSNPGKFQAGVSQFRTFTDKLFNIYNNTATDKIGFVENFYSHLLDLSAPEDRVRLNEYIKERATNSQGWFTKQRIFQNIDEIEQAGFKLRNQSVAQDILDYGNGVARSASANAFIKEISKTHPGEIAVGDSMGGRYQQLNRAGLGNTFVSPDLYQHVNNALGGTNKLMENPVVQAASKANYIDKSLKLAMGGFHAVKTTIRQIAMNPGSVPRAIVDMVNPESRAETLHLAVQDGTVESAGKMGVTLGLGDLSTQDSQLSQKLSKLNPINVANESLFNGLIRNYKLSLVRQVAKQFDLNDPAQLQQARGVGSQINSLMGGLNYTVLNRNKEFQTAVRFLGLAPDFNEGKIRNLMAASNITNWDPAHTFARKAVLGEAVVVGTLAELGRRVVTGKFDGSMQSLFQNAILDPNIPLPSQFNNPQTGKAQVAHLPGSDLTDIYHMATNPGQFVQARGAALPALLSRIATNKDYYGQTINQPGTPLPQAAFNLAKTDLPIPAVQGLKVAQGKQTLGAGILNTLGLRVGTDPNDPIQMSQMAYINAQKQVTKGFDQNQMAQWNTIHPQKKDIDGNIIYTPGVVDTAEKAMTYLNHPELIQAEVNMAKSIPGPHAPIWDLTPDQIRMVLAGQAKLPGQTNVFGKTASSLPWFQQYQTNNTAFFNYLAQQQMKQTPFQQQQTAQTKASSSTGPIQSPDPNLYNTDRNTYFQQLNAYNNQKLTAMGLPPLAGSSSSGGSSGSSIARSLIRSRIKKKMTIQGKKLKVAGIKMPKIRPISSKSTGVAIKKSKANNIKLPKFRSVALKRIQLRART